MAHPSFIVTLLSCSWTPSPCFFLLLLFLSSWSQFRTKWKGWAAMKEVKLIMWHHFLHIAADEKKKGVPVWCQNNSTTILDFLHYSFPEVPFWTGVHSRTWLILEKQNINRENKKGREVGKFPPPPVSHLSFKELWVAYMVSSLPVYPSNILWGRLGWERMTTSPRSSTRELHSWERKWTWVSSFLF